MIKKLILAEWVKGYEDWALIPLRLALAAVFMAHGGQKLFVWGLAGTAAGFDQMGFHPGIFWGTLVALTEFLGGISVLLGFATRWAGSALTVNMLVATLKVHLHNGFFINWMNVPNVGHGVEFNITLLAGTLALILFGAGRLSIDWLLEGER